MSFSLLPLDSNVRYASAPVFPAIHLHLSSIVCLFMRLIRLYSESDARMPAHGCSQRSTSFVDAAMTATRGTAPTIAETLRVMHVGYHTRHARKMSTYRLYTVKILVLTRNGQHQ